jgi:hypothetical protein
MQEVKTDRQYAVDCRRMAKTMRQKDRATLLKMAENGRADEAERRQAKEDGQDRQAGGDP